MTARSLALLIGALLLAVVVAASDLPIILLVLLQMLAVLVGYAAGVDLMLD